MKRWFAGSALAMLALGACTVPARQGVVWGGPYDDCTNCSGSGRSCVSGACRIDTASYPLVLEVSPAPTSPHGSGLTFTLPVTDRSGRDPAPVILRTVRLDFLLDARKYPEINRPIPLQMRLTDLLVPDGGIARTLTSRGVGGVDAGVGTLTTTVPSGHYSAYVTTSDPDFVTKLPPLNIDDLDLSSGEPAQSTGRSIGDLKSLDLSILDENGAAPLDQRVDGYDVAVYDRSNGDRVSTLENTCAHPGSAHVVLSPQLTKHTYVVRFTPPSTPCDSTAPTPLRPRYDFDYDALNVAGGLASVGIPRVATLRALQGKPDTAPVAISISGSVKSASGITSHLLSTLLFRSRKLTVPATWKTGTAFFEARTDASGSGAYSVPLLISGTYDVQIMPGSSLAPSNTFCITTVERQLINLDHQVLDLPVLQPMSVSGTVVSEAGATFDIGLITFEAGTTTTPAGTSLFSLAPIGRTTDPHFGGFASILDPGPYHMVMRVPSISGFPWVIRPRIDVGTRTTTSSQVPLGAVTVRPPVVFHGVITTPAGVPVPQAAVRARGGITDGGAVIDTIVVAETTTGADGSYTMLVPAQFETSGLAVK